MASTVYDALRDFLLSLPDTEEISSHGSPLFKVHGKGFCYFTLNHHDDGRVGIWLAAPPGQQQDMVALDGKGYYVPPYVGPKGWLGVELQTLGWNEVVARVRETWAHHAPAAIKDAVDGVTPAPPERELTAEDINPMLRRRAQAVLQLLASICRALPEATADDEQASATWRAGKKVFVRGHHREGRLKLLFWVGLEQQSMMTADPRYTLPMYYHSGGWIELDVEDSANREEIESLTLGSFRHFALKRMLKALEADSGD